MAELADVIKRLQNLPTAIEDVLQHEVWDATYSCLVIEARENVYSYSATPFFMSTRRGINGGLIDPDNYNRTVISNGNETVFEIQNVTPLQNLWGNRHTEPLTPVVESGDSRYFQPYPRPFMNEGRDRVMGGLAQQAMADGLKRRGYDIV